MGWKMSALNRARCTGLDSLRGRSRWATRRSETGIDDIFPAVSDTGVSNEQCRQKTKRTRSQSEGKLQECVRRGRFATVLSAQRPRLRARQLPPVGIWRRPNSLCSRRCTWARSSDVTSVSCLQDQGRAVTASNSRLTHHRLRSGRPQY